ncbi:MAG: preprotein translocase subunit SecE [bacterium]
MGVRVPPLVLDGGVIHCELRRFMGKVEKKDRKSESPVKKDEARKPVPPRTSNAVSEFSKFFGNLVQTGQYKPTQGFTARTATAAALGLIMLGGLWQLHESLRNATTPQWASSPMSRLGMPGVIAVASGWFIFRLINYPVFAEFLIATEAEMNKVSWTTWSDLKRATTVVLVTVILMTSYLWLVDQVWSTLLTWIGVLRIS